jgi:hypothetical protein
MANEHRNRLLLTYLLANNRLAALLGPSEGIQWSHRCEGMSSKVLLIVKKRRSPQSGLKEIWNDKIMHGSIPCVVVENVARFVSQ